jgi:hypothetical protein
MRRLSLGREFIGQGQKYPGAGSQLLLERDEFATLQTNGLTKSDVNSIRA